MVAPNFLCIGAQKSGTTWLYENLSKHDDVWVTPVKELHYFNRVCLNSELLGYWDMPHPRGMERYKGLCIPPRLKQLSWIRHYYGYGLSKDWYYRLFDERYTGGKVCGDITPDYSTLEDKGVKYVKEVVGAQTPIIFIVRDPIERSWSAAKMIFRYRGLDINEKNFDELESLLLHPVISLYSQYSRAIKLWQGHFPNFHVLSYDELCVSPYSFLEKISKIIGISNTWDKPTVEKQVWADSKKLPIPLRFEEMLSREAGAERVDIKALVDCEFISRW
ncbi:sulfotransferase [Dasania marina]|uniref:sulfotransferase n=1 Tax=Dasania marina TaxID=471499 RepID=UPI000381A3C3|nr:sulfotransferase [Dasania marina]